ncbi:hypothetical protein [Nocardia arthritidis]|uniref:DUF4878 domain-containing protein n=1 Tax=Nocardia arthritidis TaxID=228602 RepID=A0A6G9YTZ3_9NOCA|nr:hypothetical protein [Nocardia arthritidis]QIS16343.1 hypothetical protein F5544_42675 [Nocardia arthritidis]
MNKATAAGVSAVGDRPGTGAAAADAQDAGAEKASDTMASANKDAEGGGAQRDSEDGDDNAGAGNADAVTMVMRTVRPGQRDKSEETPQDEVPGSEDKTVAMRIVPNPAEAKTMALPIQIPPGQPPKQRTSKGDKGSGKGTDRVAAGAPLTKPPSTPRPAPGPKQPGPGPKQPGPQGPSADADVEETRPSAPKPGKPRPVVATAPSPADIQQTTPGQVPGPRRPQPRAVAAPQKISPESADQAASQRSKRLLFTVGGAAIAVVALIAVVVTLVTTTKGNSADGQIRGVITDFTKALKSGDLAALRNSTCGQLHDYYQTVAPDQFANLHQLSMDRKNIPIVDNVGAIKITDDKAVAQAVVYTDADPGKRSPRTFDLQKTNGAWKVCEQPAGTQ